MCFKFVSTDRKIPAVKTSKKNTEPPEHLSPHPDEAPPPEKAKPARQLENHPSHCPVGTGPTESLWPPLYLKGLAGSKPWEPLAKIKISYLWVLINPLKFSFVRSEPPPFCHKTSTLKVMTFHCFQQANSKKAPTWTSKSQAMPG